MRPFSISYTKIDKYRRCPFEYKCYTNKKLYNLYHQDSPALLLGQLVHAVLNSFYKYLSPEKRDFENLRKLFKTKLLAHKKKHWKILKDQATVNQCVEDAKRQLKNFLDSPYSKREPYLATEENQKIIVDDLQLWAKVDRIDKKKQGLQIIDYKTGRLWKPGIDPLQLNFYSLVTSRQYPDLPVVRKTYFYLKEGEEVDIEVKKEDNEETLDLTKDIAEQIQNDQQFAPKRNDKCSFCDFRSICPLMK